MPHLMRFGEPESIPNREELETQFLPFANRAKQGAEAMGEYFDELMANLLEIDQKENSSSLREWFVEAHIEAFRQGIDGVIQDNLLTKARSWGFDLSGISAPVHIWHGDQDNIENAKYLAEHIPNCNLTILQDVGHILPPEEGQKPFAFFAE